MNYTIILKKSEGLLLWIYRSITNKFTSIFKKLKDRFPIISRYPLLKYSLIPLLIALFLLLRYIMKYVINEVATWTSGFLGEITGYTISEGTIVLSTVAIIIILRVATQFNKQKKKNVNESGLNYENAK